MNEVAITALPAIALHQLEIWSDPIAVSRRVEAYCGFPLPAMGRSAKNNTLSLVRFQPCVWLVEGEASLLAPCIGDDGALTAIGGGIVRVELSGTGWRTLLMEGGVFDAESPSFAVGCTAATIINHIDVHLHVGGDHRCIVYIPASFSDSLLHFWRAALASLNATTA